MMKHVILKAIFLGAIFLSQTSSANTGSLATYKKINTQGTINTVMNDNQCQSAIKLCGNEAKKIKMKPLQCKPLRDCKKQCRGEKKVCKTSCKNVKKTCMKSCKGLKGKDKRNCRKSCRKMKKSCKKSCKTVKTDCKTTCRSNFKTPSCKQARIAILSSTLKTIPACAQVAQCVQQK